MPTAQQLLCEHEDNGNPTHAETLNLYLLSLLPPELLSTSCMPGLADKEAHLCLSQANEVLNNIQHHLHMMPSVIGFGHGQHTATQQLTQKTQALMDIGQVPCKDPSLWCPIHSHL